MQNSSQHPPMQSNIERSSPLPSQIVHLQRKLILSACLIVCGLKGRCHHWAPVSTFGNFAAILRKRTVLHAKDSKTGAQLLNLASAHRRHGQRLWRLGQYRPVGQTLCADLCCNSFDNRSQCAGPCAGCSSHVNLRLPLGGEQVLPRVDGLL